MPGRPSRRLVCLDELAVVLLIGGRWRHDVPREGGLFAWVCRLEQAAAVMYAIGCRHTHGSRAQTLRWLLTGDLRGPASARVAKNASPGPQTRGARQSPMAFSTWLHVWGRSPKLYSVAHRLLADDNRE